MKSCIIFIPEYIQQFEFCYLYGSRDFDVESNCCVFYVYELSNVLLEETRLNLLGVFNDKLVPRMPLPQNWVVLKKGEFEILLDWVVVDHEQFTLAKSLFIKYNLNSFYSSELLLNGNQADYDGDHFKKLAYYIKLNKSNSERRKSSYSLLMLTMPLLTSILFLMDKVCMVVKYSTFAIHFKDCLRNLLCVLKSFDREKRISIRSGNYLFATFIDMMIGAVVLHSLCSVDEIFAFFSKRAENVINSITVLVEWLMGSPAGLKLNHPLNQIIGGFFLYNIDLWWTFLGLVEPVLNYGFYIFSNLGFLGFSYQIAILADLFILVTFHVYCIYVYAARLYRLQVQGLWSLSKLVIGKKRNPIPGRIDSCPYTTEQLFVGTISFTVLLFLLPTVLVYYIVFVIMRLGVVGLCGIMTRTRYYIQIIPAYVTLIWLFRPSLTSMTVRFDARSQDSKSGVVSWEAEAIPVSWLETVKTCIPRSIIPPTPVKWTELIHNITTGRLIYPL